MILIDMTTEVITLEPLEDSATGVLAEFMTCATSTVSDVVRWKNPVNIWEMLAPTSGARSPEGFLREYQARHSGTYLLVSATRGRGKTVHTLNLHLEEEGPNQLKLTILPGSSAATWIVGDLDPCKFGETQAVQTYASIRIENGRIASVQTGDEQAQKRPTIWDRLEDDPF